jgi:Questin oxidase-like
MMEDGPVTDEHQVMDEALDRLHQTGPEWRGYLSNHGPMVVEAMVRRGHADEVEGWVDWYETRLEAVPTRHQMITEKHWREALGDPSRLGDWIAFFDNELGQRPWSAVLEMWWPRLLPGLAASATHSVIRVGHAVEALRDCGPSAPRIGELGQSLAYWAGRWLPVPNVGPPSGRLEVAEALGTLPALPEAELGFTDLLPLLGSDPRWPDAASALRPTRGSDDVREQLTGLVTAATLHYRTHAHGEPIMLVHAATAPNAVLRVLPSLPEILWESSLHAAWAASAAITMIYNPRQGSAETGGHVDRVSASAADTFALAVEHRDAHVIKLADTALDVYRWTAGQDALDAVHRAVDLIKPA